MSNSSFWDHPIEKLEEALNLKKQIHALQEKLSNLFVSDDAAPEKRKPGRPAKKALEIIASSPKLGTRGRKPFSAATKAKMAAAQKARWAAKKGSGPVATTSSKPAKKGRRTMSPEAREKIAAAQRARWAKQKA